MSRPRKVLAVAAAALASLGVATSARAAEPTPFTITENVREGTFTATGAICPSGTFSDDARFAPASEHNNAIDNRGGFNLVIHTVYTCADGSGSFTALKLLRVAFTDNGIASTGEIQLLGGTGSYAGLVGHGTDSGFINFDTEESAGTIAGFIT